MHHSTTIAVSSSARAGVDASRDVRSTECIRYADRLSLVKARVFALTSVPQCAPGRTASCPTSRCTKMQRLLVSVSSTACSCFSPMLLLQVLCKNENGLWVFQGITSCCPSLGRQKQIFGVRQPSRSMKASKPVKKGPSPRRARPTP